MTNEAFQGWAIVELMGHRKLAGYVSQAEQFGCAMLRLDVPGPNAGDPHLATQYYGGSSIYCITPTTEEIARGFARSHTLQPVSRWELPGPSASVEALDADADEDASDV